MALRESSASRRKGLRGVINFAWKKRPKETGDGDGEVDMDLASSVPATPSKITTGRFMTGIDTSQSAQSSPVPSSVEPQSREHVETSPGLSESSIQPPATTVSGVSPRLASLAQTVPVAQSTTATESSHSLDIPERLWNQAYDELKDENDTWVEAYERILSHKLNGGDSSSMNLESQKNDFKARDHAERRSMMEELVRRGLKKTEEEANVKQVIREAMQGALNIKDMISFALQSVPQAALAWAGVCFAFQVSFIAQHYDNVS